MGPLKWVRAVRSQGSVGTGTKGLTHHSTPLSRVPNTNFCLLLFCFLLWKDQTTESSLDQTEKRWKNGSKRINPKVKVFEGVEWPKWRIARLLYEITNRLCVGVHWCWQSVSCPLRVVSLRVNYYFTNGDLLCSMTGVRYPRGLVRRVFDTNASPTNCLTRNWPEKSKVRKVPPGR